jgi:hypothetical protein
MGQRNMTNHWFTFAVLAVAIFGANVAAEVLYIDGISGDDSSPGTKDKPLKTISKAAGIVNGKTEPGPTIIKILPGIYNLTETVIFRSSRPYTQKERLTIEATILPDDPTWKPQLMPVILSTEDTGKPDVLTETYSLKIQGDIQPKDTSESCDNKWAEVPRQSIVKQLARMHRARR